MQEFTIVGRHEGRAVSLPLARMLIKSEDAGVGEGKLVGELTAEPGFSGPGPHRHGGQAELFYVLEGEFTFQVEGEEILLGPGMSIVIRPGTEHNFANDSPESAKLLVIGATEEIDLYANAN